MIVSMQIDVLPVWRSPMISSRWPRPTFVIASIGLMPVAIGSFTGWRWTTPGALNSAGRVSVVFTSPLPSSGLPSGSTMRPSRASPTGTSSRAAGALHLVALLDPVPLAEQHGADVVGLEVQRETRHVVRELEQLHRHDVVEAVHARDAVGDRQHRAHLGEVGAAVLEPLDALLEDAGDLVWLDLHCVESPYAAFATCLRSRSSLLRTLASRTMFPTRTTSPPRTSGSTFELSSTVLPACSSMRLPISCTRLSSRPTALVTVTGRRYRSAAQRASQARRTRKRTGSRGRSASSLRKFTMRSSASLTTRSTPSRFSSEEK